MRRSTLLAVALVLISQPCGPTRTSLTPGVDAAAPPAAPLAAPSGRSGAQLYASLCAVCHGTDGRGYKADNAPSLVNPTFVESVTDEQLRRYIVDGRPGTAMAAYGKERGGPLGPSEIASL